MPLILSEAICQYTYAEPDRTSSIDKLGVGISPEQFAKAVWHASHGKRVHWRVSASMHIFSLVNLALPFARRSLIKLATG